MALRFRITIEDADSPSIFEAYLKANKFPKDLHISELDILSMMRMARSRNKNLYQKILNWYGKIDEKFRMI